MLNLSLPKLNSYIIWPQAIKESQLQIWNISVHEKMPLAWDFLLSCSFFSSWACSFFLSSSSSLTRFCSFRKRVMSMAAFSIPISWSRTGGRGKKRRSQSQVPHPCTAPDAPRQYISHSQEQEQPKKPKSKSTFKTPIFNVSKIPGLFWYITECLTAQHISRWWG